MTVKKNILFGFNNTASFVDNTIPLLDQSLFNIKAIAVNPSKYQSFKWNNWLFIHNEPKKSFLKKITYNLKAEYLLIKAILWADIIYLTFEFDKITKLELYIKILYLFRNKKQIFIEWVGSDIRSPKRLMKINPYGSILFDSESSIKLQTLRSLKNQKLANKLNADIITSPEMSLYLNPNYISSYYNLYQRVQLDFEKLDILPNDVINKKPIIVHTPSNPKVKGSKHVREAIKKLKEKGLDFEYIEITNKTRKESLQAIKSSDIFIDQLYVGGYGMASCEAMALGKPVIIYLMPAALELFPEDLPLINVNINNLEDKLTELIKNKEYRVEQGIKSKDFIREHYSNLALKKGIESILIKTAQKFPNQNHAQDFS